MKVQLFSRSITQNISQSFLIATLFFCLSAGAKAGKPQLQAAVAMPDRFSAEVAESILKQGGNAVDAAIAVGFSLAVTLPEAGNVGGGGFMLVHFNGQNQFIDYREVAPLEAHRDMYLDQSGEVIADLSLYGGLASGVPGTVAGMWEAHQKFAYLSWQQLIAPAIRLAEDGFIVPQHLAEEKEKASLKLQGKKRINFEAYFSNLKAGFLFKQPELAETLKRISKTGVDDFYRGKTAELIVAQMKKTGGLINKKDLACYQAKWRAPLSAKWAGFQLLSSPPPSSGGIALLQLLKMKEIQKQLFESVDHNSSQYIHLIAELEKRVYADRAEYLGDPDFWSVPTEKLLADDYLKARASEISIGRISETKAVKPGLAESPQTTHYSIIDQWGNAVSNTYTLNTSFGSGVVVEGAGFLMNNEMDDFSAKPGVPNAYGVVGGRANEITPGKRMLSSMSPTILLKGNKVHAVVGTPGGSTIITSVFQTLVNLIDFDFSPQDAVDATRFHHQLLPKDVIFVNPSIDQGLRQQLEDRGYTIEPVYLGDVQLVVKSAQKLQAAADSRGRGESRVFHWNQD